MFLILAHHNFFSSSDRSFLILAEEEFNGLPNDVSKSGLVSQSSLSLECVTCETEDEVCYEISTDLFHGHTLLYPGPTQVEHCPFVVTEHLYHP